MKRLIHIVCIGLISLAPSVHADTFRIAYEHGRTVRSSPAGSRPVVGLALSGGGSRGLAHIGVIDVLEDAGITIDRIAGTSMGSIVGGLYAAGYSPEAMADIVLDLDWSEAFSNDPPRRSIYIGEKEAAEWPLFELRFDGFKTKIPSSLSSGQRILSLLSWLTLEATYSCRRDFDRLPIPFKAIATDLRTGRKVTLTHGNLGHAIQASSTIPLLFSPVEIDNLLLVDGGLKDNLPIDEVRNMGSSFVIAVAIDESMHRPGDLDNPLNIADQVTSILMRNVTELSKTGADFIINPNMERFSSRDFRLAEAMVEEGRIAARQALPALLDSLAEVEKKSSYVTVTSIEISSPDAAEMIDTVISRTIRTGETVTYAAIFDAIENIWDTGRFFSVEADIDPLSGLLRVTAETVPGNAILRVVVTGPQEPDILETTFSTIQDGVPVLSAAQTTVDSLVRQARLDGYSFAEVTESELDRDLNMLVVTAEAPRVTRILIDSGLTSRRELIMREGMIKVGDIVNLDRIMKWVENLYGTTMYELVWIDAEPYRDGVGLRVHIREKNWVVARFGLRYDEAFSSEGRIDLVRENIFGFGNQLIVTGHMGQRRNILLLESRNNRIFSSLYSFSLKTYRQLWMRRLFSGDNVYDYDDERYGTVLSLGQQMDKLGDAMFQFRTETVLTRYPVLANRKNFQKEIRTIAVRSLIDSYDRYPFPRNGHVNNIYIESATEVFGGSEQYVKIFWDAAFARTYWRKHTFSGGFVLGTADPSIPEIESFSLGGDATRVNCYDWSSVASHFYADFPGLPDESRFGTRLTVGRLNYRLFIPRQFFLDLTYSVGNVWPKGTTVSARDLIQGYGVTGSFDTFAGPIRIGWGITSEGDEHVYMSGGWEF